MNRNAANALLKILEEPPRTRAAAAGRPQPGPAACRRSARAAGAFRWRRCRAADRCAGSWRNTGPICRRPRPRRWPRSPAAASAARSTSPPPAGSSLPRPSRSCSQVPRIDVAGLHAFADRLARTEAEDAYRAVEELLSQFSLDDCARLAVAARRRSPARSASNARATPAGALGRIARGDRPDFARTDALNLDRKQTILGAFFAIDGAAR